MIGLPKGDEPPQPNKPSKSGIWMLVVIAGLFIVITQYSFYLRDSNVGQYSAPMEEEAPPEEAYEPEVVNEWDKFIYPQDCDVEYINELRYQDLKDNYSVLNHEATQKLKERVMEVASGNYSEQTELFRTADRQYIAYRSIQSLDPAKIKENYDMIDAELNQIIYRSQEVCPQNFVKQENYIASELIGFRMMKRGY